MQRLIDMVLRKEVFYGFAADIRTEILRKSIHLLIGLVPLLASINLGFTLALLLTGTIAYAYCELARLDGYEIAFISRITEMASRKRDFGKFVMGPITLGFGAAISLMLYPEPAASIAIYALAFGDGLSSLVGKLFGSIRIPHTGGKSLEGSATCFLAVFIAAYRISGRFNESALIGFAATVIEAIPSRDFDNILLPAGTGAVAAILLS